MNLKTRYIGSHIIELIVESSGTIITEDIADLDGGVDTNLIQQLRDLADELEEHNEKHDL